MGEIFKSILFIIGVVIAIYVFSLLVASHKKHEQNILLELKTTKNEIANLKKEIDEKDALIDQLQSKIALNEKKNVLKMKSIENIVGEKLAREFTKEGF